MIATTLSLAESTLFAELQQQVATAPSPGTVYSRERDGIRYLYAKVPVGVERIDLFLGKAGDPDAEAKANRFRKGMELARERRRLVAMLKRAGVPAPSRILGATLDALSQAGLFDRGAVLVGTAAYMMFGPLVGAQLPAPTMMTGDLDLATPDLKLAADPPERLEAILKRGDPTFEAVLQTDPRLPASRFRTAQGFLLDLVTPTLRRSDRNPMPMDRLEAGAAPLHYLDWLIADPVPSVALWGSGVAINLPQPARFAVHKLILAQKRDTGGRIKRQKDLLQAKALIDAMLASDSYALMDAMTDAFGRGRDGWRGPIAQSLNEIGKAELIAALES